MKSSKRITHTFIPKLALDEVHIVNKSTRRSTHNTHTYNKHTDYTHNTHTHIPKLAVDELHKSGRRITQKRYTNYTKAVDELHKHFFKPLKSKEKSGVKKINTFNTIKTFKERISHHLKRWLCYNTYEKRSLLVGRI